MHDQRRQQPRTQRLGRCEWRSHLDFRAHLRVLHLPPSASATSVCVSALPRGRLVQFLSILASDSDWSQTIRWAATDDPTANKHRFSFSSRSHSPPTYALMNHSRVSLRKSFNNAIIHMNRFHSFHSVPPQRHVRSACHHFFTLPIKKRRYINAHIIYSAYFFVLSCLLFISFHSHASLYPVHADGCSMAVALVAASAYRIEEANIFSAAPSVVREEKMRGWVWELVFDCRQIKWHYRKIIIYGFTSNSYAECMNLYPFSFILSPLPRFMGFYDHLFRRGSRDVSGKSRAASSTKRKRAFA